MPSIFSRSTRSNNSALPSLPLSATLPTDSTGQFVDTIVPQSQSGFGSSSGYGYLSAYPNLSLGLPDLQHLVSLVSEHLDVETPFVFRSDAWDLDAGRVSRLIDKYVQSLRSGKGSRGGGGGGGGRINFAEEAKFAGPHELGMLLRWALARVTRIESPSSSSSRERLTHGLIPYLAYLNWARHEHMTGYPPTHFASLFETRASFTTYQMTTTETGEQRRMEVKSYREVIPEPLKSTMSTLFALFARLISRSAKSGITPPSLSPLFGPLLFGLDSLDFAGASPSSPHTTGNDDLSANPTSFESTYEAYLCSVHATEHLLLSFIRWQDTPASVGGGAHGAGGIPTRLKEWIRDYPKTLSGHNNVLLLADNISSNHDSPSTPTTTRLPPRKGAKTTRVVSVRRTVPQYDRDLVRSSAKWASPYLAGGAATYGSPTGVTGSSLGGSREWGRIAPTATDKSGNGKLPARYSEGYRKKMNIPLGVEPGSSPFAPATLSPSNSSSLLSPLTRSTSSTSSYSHTDISTSPSSSSPATPSTPTTSSSSHQQRFKTLTDAQWGLFETSGFLSSSLSSPSSSSSNIISFDAALRFDLTESARKARTKKKGRESVSWGDFVNGGFDRDRSSDPLSISTGTSGMNYGSSFGTRRDGADATGTGGGGGYVGADGKIADVGEFALDTGLDAALQFNLSEFGMFGDGAKKERERLESVGKEKGVGLTKKLKRKEKPLPPFTWSTTPVLATETLIEAAFVDVWVDLIVWGFAGNVSEEGLGLDRVYGLGTDLDPNTNISGMALSRTFSRDDADTQDGVEMAKLKSDLFKECNWVLVEFKALPNSSSPALNSVNAPSNDPRTSTSLLLFEEYVPREYRAQLGHQLAGIHPSLILNPSSHLNSVPPYSSNASNSPSAGRVRLGSLFSSPNNAAASTSSLMDTGRGKKEKKIKEAKSKKDKKDKSKAGASGNFFTGSTRTLTPSASTPTPYQSGSSAPTPTPYSMQNQGESPSPSTPIGVSFAEDEKVVFRPPLRGDSLNVSSKEMDFEGMLRDENRGTKVITLNGALHTLDSQGGMSEAEVTDEEGQYSVSAHTHPSTHEASPEDGAFASAPPPPVVSPPSTSAAPESEAEISTLSMKRAGAANIFRLPTTASTASPPTSKSSSSKQQPSAKPKGPKAPRARRYSKQNLVPAEYHTVEFETRLTGLASGGETEEEGDAHTGADRQGDYEDVPEGDGFVEEAARRRRAARIAERERLKSERRGGGKRFSLSLGSRGGAADADDEAWVDIVVPSITSAAGAGVGGGKRSGEESKPRDPDEASQEVARVLSAVRGGEPYALDDESDFESGPRQHSFDGVAGAVRGSDYSDDIEVQTVPAKGIVHPDSNFQHENGNGHRHDVYAEDKSYEDGEEDKPVVPPRRPGYFDLHPERRPGPQTPQERLNQPRETKAGTIGTIDSGLNRGEEEEDPRARYEQGSDDEQDDEDVSSPKDLDRLYAAKSQAQRERDRSSRPLPTLPPNGSSTPSSPPAASTSPASVPLSKSNILTATPSGTPGKTAALIEMYREREKKSSTSPSLNSPQSRIPVHQDSAPASSPPAPIPSRIPVKTGLPTASSGLAPSLPTSPAAPVPAAKPLNKSNSGTIGINSELDDADDDESAEVNMEELIPPMKLGSGDEAGRASPGRYIHGAPLHNVLEEEEEEE